MVRCSFSHILAAVMLITVLTAGLAINSNWTEQAAALQSLKTSITYSNGELSFMIPKDYPNPASFNILIAGRFVADDGFSMSVHYLTEENDTRIWEAGKRYVIPFTGAFENYTSLTLDAFLPDGKGGTAEISVDLLSKAINRPHCTAN